MVGITEEDAEARARWSPVIHFSPTLKWSNRKRKYIKTRYLTAAAFQIERFRVPVQCPLQYLVVCDYLLTRNAYGLVGLQGKKDIFIIYLV